MFCGMFLLLFFWPFKTFFTWRLAKWDNMMDECSCEFSQNARFHLLLVLPVLIQVLSTICITSHVGSA